MNRVFRKYHRMLATIISLPLLITILSGVLISIIDQWFQNPDLAYTVRRFHTMEIVGLQGFYPLLNGLGLLGLLLTGLSMTKLFNKRSTKEKTHG